MMLLAGTKEWEQIKIEEGIEEDIVKRISTEESDSPTPYALPYNDMAIEEDVNMLSNIKKFVLQSVINKMAEKVDYDMENINELHRGSVVFREELGNI